MMIALKPRWLLLSLSLAAAACGAVAFSAPIAINLKAKSSEVRMAVISDEKNINTETSNPYGKFISDARAELGGKDPTSIDLDSVELLLAGQSRGVANLEEVFSGRVDVLFIMEESKNSYPAAHVDSVTGPGPIALVVDLDPTAIVANDTKKMLEGGFKTVIRGSAATGFDGKDAEANLQLTFGFSAYE